MNEQPSVVIGRLTSARRGLTWDLTDADALWLGRAIVGESTRDAQAVASTMLRRLAFVSDQRGRAQWPSLTALLVGSETSPGYSQPVAVQWRERGEPARIARRARIRSLTWAEIPPHVRETVLAMLTGQRAFNVPGAVHFAVPSLVQTFLANNPGSVRVPYAGGNYFVATAASRSYPEPRVTPTAEGLALVQGRASTPLLPPLALGALAALTLLVLL